MNIGMPFASGSAAGPSGVWGNSDGSTFRPSPTTGFSKTRPVSMIPRRVNTLTVETSRAPELGLSRTPSPSCSMPLTPELMQFDRDRPRSTSSVSTIVPCTPDGASDDGHDITAALKGLLPTALHFTSYSSSRDCSDDEDDGDVFYDFASAEVKNSTPAPTVRLIQRDSTAIANTDNSSTTPVSRLAPSPVIRSSPTAPGPPVYKVVAHGNVAARKVATPVVPAAASSMTGKKGHAAPSAYRNPINDGDNEEFGAIKTTPVRSFAARNPTSPLQASTPVTGPVLTPASLRRSGSMRVRAANPQALFAISERSEPTLTRQAAVPQPRRASSGGAGPHADDSTVNKWPWGARRVTPIPAEVVAAVRNRASS